MSSPWSEHDAAVSSGDRGAAEMGGHQLTSGKFQEAPGNGNGKLEADDWEETNDPAPRVPSASSWSLPAAWGENASQPQRPAPAHPAAPAPAGAAPPHKPAASPSPAQRPLWELPAPPPAAPPAAPRRRASPGALRAQSSTSRPQTFPLPDLLRAAPPHHAIPMAHLIHSMASLSRAGRERGARKTNQDSSFAFRQYCRPHQAIAGVLDGHGPHGHTVSAFVKQHLPAMVAAQLRRRGEVAAPAALAAAFLEAQAGLRGAAASVNARLSGTTAVVALLQGRRLTCAWVGDSRAMLVRREAGGGVRGVALTRDHKPTQAGELARVLAAGGRVERLRDSAGREVGPHRVWLPGAWVPGLAMSRALGDFVAGSVGVSAQPETAAVEVEAGDEFLVVASDGVWEFIGTQEAAELVGGCASAEEACRALVDASTRAWAEMDEGITDDITAVVARLLPPGAAQGQAAAAAQEPQEPQEPQA